MYYLQSRYYNPELGRFINADDYLSTGQGLLGNNAFTYCLNNPVAYIDSLGTSPIAIAVGTIAVCAEAVLPIVAIIAVLIVVANPDFQEAITQGISNITTAVFTWVDEQKNAITEVMSASLEKSTKKSSSWHVHHIVAQNSRYASPAAWILNKLLPDGVNNGLNLVLVKQKVHQRLHTLRYYNMVNYIICQAYVSAGQDVIMQRNNVINALIRLRVFILSLNALEAD